LGRPLIEVDLRSIAAHRCEELNARRSVTNHGDALALQLDAARPLRRMKDFAFEGFEARYLGQSRDGK
jgi:hypothetical protein